MQRRSQALLFVTLLVLVMGIVAAIIATMWQADMQVGVKDEIGLAALYLAEAGVERGKREVLTGYWSAGIVTISDQSDLDISGDNYQFLYDVRIVTPASSSQRTVRGVGKVYDSAGNEIARREVEVVLDGISDTVNNITGNPPPDGIDDSDANNSVLQWSWRER